MKTHDLYINAQPEHYHSNKKHATFNDSVSIRAKTAKRQNEADIWIRSAYSEVSRVAASARRPGCSQTRNAHKKIHLHAHFLVCVCVFFLFSTPFWMCVKRMVRRFIVRGLVVSLFSVSFLVLKIWTCAFAFDRMVDHVRIRSDDTIMVCDLWCVKL